MRLLLIAVAALVFLGALWGPAFALALHYYKLGDASPLRQLRFLYPAQLLVTVVLAFAADVFGFRQPAALLAGITLCVGACGAGLLWVVRWLQRRRHG
ncbi:hypothetical protein KW842_19050 [Duganella sp. sic0402]|uniref:hypothetical protein n=1 Tax=Duganella sp. sic0402 TaxID=2854786 RepID=UPI001C438C15|nr:hypothetical protein [Duganella sp. sic0402]MBV7537872.1 hypothetical protein [Duganella sp. sic0402]